MPDPGERPRPEGTPAPRPDPYRLRGQSVAQYRVEDVLGSGGMGVVYRARDTRLARDVALKFLPPELNRDARAKARFVAEAQAASALDHPNICTIHEIGETEAGQSYIAMAFCPGRTLADTLADGPLPAEEVTDLGAQIARGLARAHEMGVVHRDVKPANVIVSPRGQARIVDFGVAKVADADLTSAGQTVGTIAYMSPEQSNGAAVDGRSDVWALGVVLYQALTGAKPFRGAYPQAVVFSILHEDPEPVSALAPDAPPGLAAIIERCLAKDPAARYADASALAADLDALRAGTKTLAATSADPIAPDAPHSERPARWRRLAMGGLVALLAVAGAVWAWSSGGDGARPVAAPDARVRQVAVLPFTNVGDDEANQPFVDGLAYTIGATLTDIETLSDRISVLPADDGAAAAGLATADAARALGADVLVRGSAQRTDARVRLTLSVYDAATGRTATERVDTPLTDLFALQDSVALALASLLSVELSEADERALARGGTGSALAFDLYTQARGHLQRYENERSVESAIRLFEQATAEDDEYALAWAGLGEAFWRKYQLDRDAAWIERAGDAGQRAVALDPDLAPVRVTLGIVHHGTGRYAEAEREFRQAIALDPANARAHFHLAGALYRLDRVDDSIAQYRRAIELKPNEWSFYLNFGNVLNFIGRHEEAIRLYREVIRLRPDNPWGYNNIGSAFRRMDQPDSAAVWFRRATQINPDAEGPTALAYRNLGSIRFEAGDYPEAVREYRRAAARDSLDPDILYFLAGALHFAGRTPEAERAWRRMIALEEEIVAVNPSDQDALVGLAFGYASTGQPDRARDALARLQSIDSPYAGRDLFVAMTHERLGNRSAALLSLERGLGRDLTLDEIEASPWLSDLRGDPRYLSTIRSSATSD